MYRSSEKLKQPPPVSASYLWLLFCAAINKSNILGLKSEQSLYNWGTTKKYLWK
jgi:hypothetical protein